MDNSDETEPPTEEPKPRRRKTRWRKAPPIRFRYDSEEWTMTYMDTVTLLITLFVLLLSFSTINKEKFNAVAEALNLNKYGAAIVTGKTAGAKVLPLPVKKEEKAPSSPPQNDETDPEAFAKDVRAQLSGMGLSDVVEVKVSKELLDLQLNESVLFSSGEADLTDQGASVVARLVGFLSVLGTTISVEGHTDTIPIATDRFPSNWELSASRAASVARRLIGAGISAERIHIRGYADTHPLAANDTEEGRRKNRRVNLVLKKAESAGTPP